MIFEGDWTYRFIKFVAGNLIPANKEELLSDTITKNEREFDTQRKGNKRKVMKFINCTLKSHFNNKSFDLNDKIFKGIAGCNYNRFSLFDIFFYQNKLRYSNRNILLAIEFVLNHEIKCRRFFARKRSESIMNAEMKEFIDNTDKDILKCHFCRTYIYKNKYGQFIPIDKVKKMGGACVGCQYKLPMEDKCTDKKIREENKWYIKECERCAYRPTITQHIGYLAYDCGATEDQILFVIDIFNRARGFRKFEGKLTFEGIVKDLNNMSPDKFNKKYGYFYGSSI